MKPKIPKSQTARAALFKKMRIDAGLTQQNVADALEYCSRTVIWGKENGEYMVHARDLLALRAATE